MSAQKGTYSYAEDLLYCVYFKNICEVKVAQLSSTLRDPIDYTVCGILQARIWERVAFPFSRDLPNPGFEPRSPAWTTYIFNMLRIHTWFNISTLSNIIHHINSYRKMLFVSVDEYRSSTQSNSHSLYKHTIK